MNSFLELRPNKHTAPDQNYARIIELLTKIEKKSRPRKRTTLTQHISAAFQKKLPQTEVQRIVDLLFLEGKVIEINQALTYNF